MTCWYICGEIRARYSSGGSFSAIEPEQVVAVTAHCGGREIVALQLAQKIGEPAVG